MLFGEKYPDVVRVVSTGGFSKELCGGTHLENAAQVGVVKITSEESVAAGTRRITALTGPAALAHIRAGERALAQATSTLKVRTEELPARVEAMAKEIKQLKKQVAAGAKQDGPSVESLIEGATEKDGVKVIAQEIPGGNANVLRDLIDRIRRKTSPVAVMLAAKEEKKVLLIAGFSRDLVRTGPRRRQVGQGHRQNRPRWRRRTPRYGAGRGKEAGEDGRGSGEGGGAGVKDEG